MPRIFQTDKARQGRRGFPVLVILVCGLLLAMAVWWGVEIYGESLDDNQTIELPQTQDEPGAPAENVAPADSGENLPPAN